jgi:hypothetical protein
MTPCIECLKLILVKSIYPKTCALLALAIFLSCTWKIKAPDIWTVQGKVYALDSARINVEDRKVCIGAFDVAATRFAPAGMVSPTGGHAVVDNDSGFSLTIRGEDVQQNYLILAAWYDDNGDGKLDPEKERYGALQNSSEEALAFYRDNDDWMDGATREQAKDETDVEVFTASNITKVRTAWNIDGVLRGLSGSPGIASVKLRYDERRLMLGVFPSPAATFTPSLDTMVPNIGACVVGTDSLFSLALQAVGTSDRYLFALTWYDGDGDSIIDVRNEPYSIVYNSANRALTFMQARTQLTPWEWRTADGDTIGDISAANLYSTKNLVGNRYSWSIRGKVAGFSGAEVQVDSSRLKIGAFTQRPQSPLQEGHVAPSCGLNTVGTDSSFSLSIDATPTESLTVWVVLWYDLDGNDTLTPSREYSSPPQLDTSASPQYLEYRYNRQTSEWLLGAGSTVARDIDSAVFYSRNTLAAPLRTWTMKGKLQPTGTYSLAYGTSSLCMGVFFSPTPNLPYGTTARPDAGWCTIGPDSGFSLTITPPPQTALKNAYLNVTAWYDVDRDSTLDTLDEPFAQVLLPQKSVCNYYYAANQSSPWHWLIDSAAGRYVDFTTPLDTTFYVSKNLVSDRRRWTLSGVIRPDSGLTIDPAGKMYIGAFACTDTTATVRFDSVPLAGKTHINSDSSFTLALDASDVQRMYMVLVAWYDRDSNETYDPLIDPYAFLAGDSAAGRAFYYRFNTQEKEWRTLRDNKPAQNLSKVTLRADTDLMPLRTAWVINGKLRPRDTFSVAYGSNRVRLGAFSSATRTFTPSGDSLVAISGAAVITGDSSFTLQINAANATGAYITLCAWFDRDSNNILDATSEPWSVPAIASTSTIVAQYSFDTRTKLWRFAPDSNLADAMSEVEWYIGKNLTP